MGLRSLFFWIFKRRNPERKITFGTGDSLLSSRAAPAGIHPADFRRRIYRDFSGRVIENVKAGRDPADQGIVRTFRAFSPEQQAIAKAQLKWFLDGRATSAIKFIEERISERARLAAIERRLGEKDLNETITVKLDEAKIAKRTARIESLQLGISAEENELKKARDSLAKMGAELQTGEARRNKGGKQRAVRLSLEQTEWRKKRIASLNKKIAALEQSKSSKAIQVSGLQKEIEQGKVLGKRHELEAVLRTGYEFGKPVSWIRRREIEKALGAK